MSEPTFSRGHSPAFRAFCDDLERVAVSSATVLIEGENGTGKSHAARQLHAWSPRARGPWISVSIAALPESLVEAELFGHEEGAFTGAEKLRLGRIRAAEGGTLLLDGIELLPLAQQVKLLRVLQERVVEPLGGTPQAVDVRILATSSVSLLEEVQAGRFREDLYYRLAVVSLRVPPLRSRGQDLPELVEVLSARAAARAKVARRPLSPEAEERLAAHSWPGNVRELENALERVLVLGATREGGSGKEATPIVAEEFNFLEEACFGAADRLAQEALAHGLDVDHVTQAMIEAALREQRGNLSAAARQVGLSRRAFDYRRRKGPQANPSETE